jgi:hypothetical protein
MSWKNLGPYIAILLAVLIFGMLLGRASHSEGFVNVTESSCTACGKPKPACKCPCNSCGNPKPACKCPCNSCGNPKPCGCNQNEKCPRIDWSRYVLKSSIPPCPAQPDMSRYMLKTECPPPPDMSRYILKSAVPACPPCISTCNKPCKIGDCPPCPRPRCPVVECPEPKACPPCASVEPPRCPEPKVHCKARYEPEEPWTVRPLMSTISGM